MIPNNVTEIYDGTFSKCLSLMNVTIPNSIKKIGKNAFSECLSLRKLRIPSCAIDIDKNSIPDNCKLIILSKFKDLISYFIDRTNFKL